DDHDDDYDDWGPRRFDPYKSWRGTRLGVFLVIIGNWVYLGTIGLGILAFGILLLAGASMFNSASSDPFSAGTGASVVGFAAGTFLLMGLVGLAYFASWVLYLIGQGLCMQVPAPRRNNAVRVLAIVTFCCSCLAFLCDGGSFAGSSRGGLGLYGLSGLIH